ncbi:adenosine receptor A3 isoform X2 [Vombatus ursinus]|uniref:Transmembrane and immunoglobulin domain containing 3 n=2 Tax=Vombatus ursinus TaxID=29139 RepID=A0A4X2KPQ6_VOMUR|nr:adenosine receptor A3 isoform X2 [Vombatus ursinus]
MLGNDTTLTPGSIVYITVEIVIGLCAIVGNVLVIWVVKLNPGLQNTTFYFIVSLAVADIAVGVLVMPLAIVISLGITIHFYNCLFMTCLLLVFTHASIMALLAIAVDRYLRVKLTIRSSGPQRPGSPSRLLLCFSFQESASSAMQLFLMLLSAVCTDAIVMDGKVKEAFVQDKTSVTCNYDPYYKDYPKYWCRGYYRNYCDIIASTSNSTDHVALKDTGMQFIITLTCLTKEDTGWYWCGIQRDYARDYMDYTELIVFDGVRDTADLQRKQNRTCKGSGVGYSGNHSRRTCHQPEIPLRLSILSICVLIMGTGVITTAVVLLKRKQIQKHNWGKVLIKLGDHSLGSSPMVPAPL